MQSLEKLLPLRPSHIYPGHGPVIRDGVDRIRQYIEHRLQRERQIVEAMQASDCAMTLNEIVDLVYKVSIPLCCQNLQNPVTIMWLIFRVPLQNGTG